MRSSRAARRFSCRSRLLVLSLSNIFEHSFTPIIPISVDSTVATSDGNKKSAGFAEPAVARMPITVVGNICKLVAESTVSIIISVDALRLPLSIRFIAFIAMGVAALPSPSMFAEMFIVMNFRVSVSADGNSRTITGRKSRSSPRDKPSFSINEKNPSQNAYNAKRLSESSTAPCAPVTIELTAADGSVNNISPSDAAIMINQIIATVYYMCRVCLVKPLTKRLNFVILKAVGIATAQ